MNKFANKIKDGLRGSPFFNYINMTILIGCVLCGLFFSHSVGAGFLKGIASLDVFPFTSIDRHADRSLYPDAVRGQLIMLWLCSPILFFSTYIRSVRFPHYIGGKKIFFILIMGGVFLFFSIVYAPPEPSFCKGCEYGNAYVGAFIRWGKFVAIAFIAGQLRLSVFPSKNSTNKE